MGTSLHPLICWRQGINHSRAPATLSLKCKNSPVQAPLPLARNQGHRLSPWAPSHSGRCLQRVLKFLSKGCFRGRHGRGCTQYQPDSRTPGQAVLVAPSTKKGSWREPGSKCLPSARATLIATREKFTQVTGAPCLNEDRLVCPELPVEVGGGGGEGRLAAQVGTECPLIRGACFVPYDPPQGWTCCKKGGKCLKEWW